jgi:hypothetical protein
MKAKFVYEAKNLEDLVKKWEEKQENESSYGKEECVKMINEYLPFLQQYNPEYIELNLKERKNEKKIYNKFDYFDLLMPNTTDESLTLLIGEKEKDDGPGVKFYYDATAYNGDISDEYNDTLDFLPISQCSEEVFNEIIEDIQNNSYGPWDD